MSVLESISRNIYPLDRKARNKAISRLDSLIHPPKSLGGLEDLCVRLAGIYSYSNLTIPNKIVLAFGADHGVYEEGVANDPQSLSAYHFPNFVNGKSAVSCLCRQCGADVMAVDVGIDTPEELEGILCYKLRRSTSNMKKGPAMTRREAIRSLEIGIELAERCIVKDYRIIGLGEMGIANTTAATAIISVITGESPRDITGRGATLPEDKISHKAQVIEEAIALNNPNPTDGIDILMKVGGFEIGAMAGAILGCSANRIPVILDGYVSYAAAMIAYRINPIIKDYIIASCEPVDRVGHVAKKFLGLEPLINISMSLGEGSGATLAFGIIDAAIAAYANMATFDEVDLGERNKQYKKNTEK